MFDVTFCFTCSLFFFFKQKTAYEMRISDWSSDVCSSDLTINFGKAIADFNETNELRNFSYVFSTGPEIDSLSISGSVGNALTHEIEIGRASCRERVCQYV